MLIIKLIEHYYLQFVFNIKGLQNEGWFDPYLLLAALKLKCASLDVQFVKGEVVGFKQKDIMVRDAQDLEKAYRDKILDQIYVSDKVIK